MKLVTGPNKQYVNFPTNFTFNSNTNTVTSTCIDLVLCNNDSLIGSVSECGQLGASHHVMMLIEVYILAYIYTYIYISIHTYIYIYIHTYIHSYIPIQIYLHIQTYTHRQEDKAINIRTRRERWENKGRSAENVSRTCS